MGRLILIGIVVLLVVWLLKRALAGPRRSGDAGDGPRSSKPSAEAGEAQGDLVSCARCDVKLPKSEAYAARGVLPGEGGRFYCSEEHWRLGPQDG